MNPPVFTRNPGTCWAHHHLSSVKPSQPPPFCPQQLQMPWQSHRLAELTGRSMRVVGWYHSHPHITVWPSHVGKCYSGKRWLTKRWVLTLSQHTDQGYPEQDLNCVRLLCCGSCIMTLILGLLKRLVKHSTHFACLRKSRSLRAWHLRAENQ